MKKKKERRGVDGRWWGVWFHWPLECVSNIFRVCSGASLSSCSSHLSRLLCAAVGAAADEMPAASAEPHYTGEEVRGRGEEEEEEERRRGLRILHRTEPYLQTSVLRCCIRSGPKKKKSDNAGDQVIKLQGPGEAALFQGPETSGAAQHHG